MHRCGNRHTAVRSGVLIAGVALSLLCLRLPGAAHPAPAGVTWKSTIARVLERKCGACHGEGGHARPRLDDYRTARLEGGAIKEAVLTRHMPRWYAAEGFGHFANDPTLTPHEVELVAQWVEGGTPHGDPAPVLRGVTPPAATERPDLTLVVAAKHRIEAGSHTFRLPSTLSNARWIRGWTFEPGHRALVTGAVLAINDGPPLGTWVPGEGPTFLPEGVAARLPAGAEVRLTVYYRDPPAAAVDSSSVGLYFGPPPARPLEHMTLPCGTTRLPHAIDALAIRPAIGSTAWSMAIVARTRRGSEPLGWFRKYPAEHPQTYRFRTPVALAEGTAIEVGATHGECRAELDFVRAGQRGDRRATAVDASASAIVPASANDSGYWCPMHTAVRSAERGLCGQCGMGLVPVRPETEGRYRLDVDVIGTSVSPSLRLVVREPGSGAIVRDFELVHERIFHLFVVGDDLEQFAHVHPEAQPDGSFVLSPAPGGTTPYQLYADFLPVGGTPQMVRKAMLPRPSKNFSGSPSPHLGPQMGERSDAGLRVAIEPDATALIAGVPRTIAFRLADAVTGQPVSDLQPYLGAWGHAFIVSDDLTDAVHSHPLTSLESAGGPTIVFQQRFPRPGAYRLWAQFMRHGRVATVSFTVVARAAS